MAGPKARQVGPHNENAHNESNKNVRDLAYSARKQPVSSIIMSRDLENIDKLLSAAQEIMKREPTLDREAIEYMRRLRVKIRFAAAGAAGVESEPVPLRAPELFKERKDKTENPVDFIKRVYAPYLYKGIVRSDLAKLDNSLYVSLNRWVSQNDGQLPEIGLPKKSDVIEDRLKANGDNEIRPFNLHIKTRDLSEPDRQQLQLYQAAQRRKRKMREP